MIGSCILVKEWSENNNITMISDQVTDNSRLLFFQEYRWGLIASIKQLFIKYSKKKI